jgi:ribosomal-protein-alanine N-acetyltransferase
MAQVYPDVYPVRLVGTKVVLRELEPTDVDAAMAWASDPAFFTYLAHEAVTSREAELTVLRTMKAEAVAQPRRQYHLGIVMRDSDRLVGAARLGIADPDAAVGDIGYGVRRDRWGQGVATDAARLLVAFGFGELGLHRIFAYHHPENVASGHVLAKVGMQHEGRLREHMRSHGAWRDSMVWGILDREWSRASNSNAGR